MTDTLLALLPWVLPPVLGAIIGYITNSLAIKMLFRPYEEKRVFGIRIPLTPGIIPKQRYHLAESIGRMVSKELLTEDAIVGQIRSDDFRRTLETNVSGITSKVFDTPLSSLSLSGVAKREGTAESFIGVLRTIVASEGFSSFISLLMGKAFEFAGNLTLADLNTNAKALETFIGDLLDSISSGTLHERAVQSVSAWLDERIEHEDLIGDYVGDRQVEWACGILTSIYEPLLKLLLSWLNRTDTRDLLAKKGKVLLRDVLNKLNLFQKLLVSAGQYDRTLEENMGGIISDALSAVEKLGSDPATLEGVVHSVRAELNALRKKKFSDVLGGRTDAIKGSISQGIGGFFDFLGRDSTRMAIAKIVAPTLDRVEEKHLRDILSGIVDIESLSEFSAGLVIDKIRGALAHKPESAEASWTKALGPGGEHLTIRTALGISEEIDRRISTSSVDAVVRMLEQRAPKILDGFDVYGMVVEKINGLDVVSVEGLLLRVIERHLKWINVFGALLGAIIGMMQIVLRIFQI